MDKCLIPQPRRCAMRFWHRLIDDSQLLDMEDLPVQTYLEHRYFRETLQQACKIPTTRPCAPGRTTVGWSACGEFAAAFPTVSVLRGVLTARGAIDVSRHANTAKGFTFCRCAELRPAPLTCANLLFAATTTRSFLTVRSRLYQRQPISASSQPSATRALVIWLQSFTMDKCLIPQPCRCTMRFWHRLIDDSQLLDMEDLPAQTFLEHRYLRETLQQACTRSLLPPALICAIPLRPNRRQILPTAWAISEFRHFITRPWTSLPQSYAEFTAACLALELRHLTTGYALPLGRSRNTKPRLRFGVSENTSLQDTVPVVTQIPQGWSPDSQFTAHSLPTCIGSIHSKSFVCDSLPTPCARLWWQEVNFRTMAHCISA